MTNTTNDQAKMKQMGINPGMVSEYSNVSLEPISFSKEDDLGNRTMWCANHSATWNHNGSQIEVEGHSFVMDNAKSQSFVDLLDAWGCDEERQTVYTAIHSMTITF